MAKSEHEKWAQETLKRFEGEKQVTVISTKTASSDYGRVMSSGEGDVAKRVNSCIVYGGSNVRGGFGGGFVTPRGVGTVLTQEQLKTLVENPVAHKHFKNGFITFEVGKLTNETVAKVAEADLEREDDAAPLTPENVKTGKKTKAKKAEENKTVRI